MKNWLKDLERGQAMMVATILFLVVSVTIIFGLIGPIIKQQKITSNLVFSRQSYFLAEAGIENIIQKLKTGRPVAPIETMTLDGNTVTLTTTNTIDGKEIIAEGEVRDLVRKLRAEILLGSGVSFHFGVQAGNGGLILENTSSVSGNVYSNGSVTGDGPANNIIRGSVVSAGPTGRVYNLRATSSVLAHTIDRATVDKDAYYQVITSSTVAGNSYPNSPDQATATMPISDEQIEEWKQSALDGGVITTPCPYRINDATTIGPVKINCDLQISGTNYEITLAGNVWVNGNIDVSNSPTIKVDSSFGNRGVAIIADKPTAPTTSGKIMLQNSAVFEGSGTPGSHVMFISQNRSAESGGAEVAIDVKNTVTGDLLVYAAHGEIVLQNNIQLKEVAAYRIRLKNTADVVYETGITNLIFDSGPSGGYGVVSWREIE